MNLISILKKYNASQPRHPKGSAKGGQWSAGASLKLVADKTMRMAALAGIKASKAAKSQDPEKLLQKMYSLQEEMLADAGRSDTSVKHRLKDGSYTPERITMHQKILDDMFKDAEAKYAPPPGEKPQVLMLAGRPGAGKSGFGKSLKIYDPSKYLVLDSDAFKEKFPEYDPERPWMVHREASDLMDTAGVIARAKGLNIVYDMTMKKSPLALVDYFRKHDYNIEMHHMKVSQETSQTRAAYRWANDGHDGKMGRLVPPAVLAEMAEVDKVFSEAKTLADDYTEYSHETLGHPVLVSASKKYKAIKSAIMKAFTLNPYKGVTA